MRDPSAEPATTYVGTDGVCPSWDRQLDFMLPILGSLGFTPRWVKVSILAPRLRRASLRHLISEGEILFHSDRVAAWTLARSGLPNIRFKSFGLCANAADVLANMTTGATTPNHLDTAFLRSFRRQVLLLHP